MNVWVVVEPWDYTTADIVGVFSTEKAAREAANQALENKKASGEINLHVQVFKQEVTA